MRMRMRMMMITIVMSEIFLGSQAVSPFHL